MNKLYHIVFDDDDTKEYYHNELRDQHKRTLPKRRQRRKPKLFNICYLYPKNTPKESDYMEYVMTLVVENILSIASLQYNLDISTKDVPIEMI